MSHKHKTLMEQYCRDWQETDKPWLRWENRGCFESKWTPCVEHPDWYPSVEYRRKQDKIKINGIEVNAPLREVPAMGTEYWVVSDTDIGFNWEGGRHDLQILNEGRACATKEDARAIWMAMSAPLLVYVRNGK